MSQQQSQLISNQGQQQQSNMQTVVPLTLGSRAANIKTITVSTSNAGTIEHRNLSNQATTIVPIQTKLLTQQTHQNITATQRKNLTFDMNHHYSNVNNISAQNSSSTSTVYYEQSGSSQADKGSNSSSMSETFGSANIRYTDKMIHSIIQNSLQNNSSNPGGSSTIRFSPSVVENQISSATSAGQQQLIGSIVPNPSLEAAVASAHMIVPAPSSSPRGILPSGSSAVLRKLSETTPTKTVKKQAKTKGFQNEPAMQVKVTQQRPLSAAVAQLTQNLKPLETRQQQQHSTASSPKTTFSERESSPHEGEWSDGSTTVSIPNSPRSDDEDLEEAILNNVFNLKSNDDMKFVKSPAKISNSGMKREGGDINSSTPRKKIKQ